MPEHQDGRSVVVTIQRSNVNHSADIDHDLARRAWRLIALTAVMLVSAIAESASAQGEISGRVMVSDSSRSPIQGAEVSIRKLGSTSTSDSSGRFRLSNVPRGQHVVITRAVGFRAESSTVTIESDEMVSWDVVLTRATGTVLPERVVEASGEPTPAKLVEFSERQRAGVGHFVTREQLAKAEGGVRQTGDVISLVPGVRVRRGGSKIWIASGRTFSVGKCAFCRITVDSLLPSDVAAGARPACFMDVYVDGAMVFDSTKPQFGLFDVNTVPPEHVAGIEVYSSAAQIPAKYNRTSGGCGVVLIWTR